MGCNYIDQLEGLPSLSPCIRHLLHHSGIHMLGHGIVTVYSHWYGIILNLQPPLGTILDFPNSVTMMDKQLTKSTNTMKNVRMFEVSDFDVHKWLLTWYCPRGPPYLVLFQLLITCQATVILLSMASCRLSKSVMLVIIFLYGRVIILDTCQ